ncbi:heme A synthase [Pseudomonas sp. PvR086]|jgi:hypothetical protein|uniref:Uncharacterized protein n=1 Tax=Pseudomonas frederiksbergensis TaxID=104087 RepID=A0A2S8HM60_9PSED|nr:MULTISPECIES: hypothetical protein [Pseudomonas]ANI63273.1 hypothetical protein PGR6_57000 [Pseudomonas sp. GR 6-02]MBD9606117.1 hypothetical protein [Pseudomonas sp. PDM08]MBD9619979.1 hypothetical protein [Pseudomonas sp. PDM07]MDR7106604.1 heme A synthase [Pseudomonas frederiksbergensis]PMY50431.1 hypothetical protein C1X70_19555 [Pseudomonas sp. FW305-53]
MSGYLAVLADSDLFGTLAILSLILALTGLRNKSRNSKLHRLLTFIVLMAIPVMHGIGTYFLNLPPA